MVPRKKNWAYHFFCGYKKYNFRIKWFDGWENHKLNLDDYLPGSTAPYKAWVLLEKRVVTVVEQ